MIITLVHTSKDDDFKVPALRKRAQESSTGPITKHYKALANSKEVAFVSLERWLELNQMVICNIFVPISIRQQKFAIAVLNEVERIAACEGLSDVRFMPSSIDSPFNNIDWCESRGYVVYSSNPMILFKAIGFNHWDAYNKFRKAIDILATGKEDVRTRLLCAWRDALQGINNDMLPEEARPDFLWIKDQLHKRPIELEKLFIWQGERDNFKQKIKKDPKLLETKTLENTLENIKNKTGAQIAKRIYKIYDTLTARRWECLTMHCTECSS